MRKLVAIIFFAATVLSVVTAPVLSPCLASSTQTHPALQVPPKPADAPGAWKRLIGEYENEGTLVNVLERDGGLFLSTRPDSYVPLRQVSPDAFTAGANSVEFRLNSSGVRELVLDGKIFAQLGFGDVRHSFHMTPVRPPEELRKEALAARPPVENRPLRKPDLVELTKLDPTIRLDIRYATTNNFMGTPFYDEPRAFLQRPAAEAVVRANHTLHTYGYGLLIHDGYRPWYVTKMFWDATPADKKQFVADPRKGSNHNRGGAVDLSLYDLRTGNEVEMPGGYDEMSDRSHPEYQGGTSLQRWRRDLLRAAMESEGFKVEKVEWWHFDYKGWSSYPVLNLRFDEISAGKSGVGRN
jgi:D-alanyl-D-alanine dipeptidase